MTALVSATIADHEYAVLDTETTGFDPATGDAMVELSIVRIAADGTRIASLSTLLNPGRDVGPTHIHRVTDDMVADAPRFEDVAGTVCDLLDGAVAVAHNADFDRNFLVAALAQAGIQTDLPMLCTMKLTDQLLLDRVADRKLATLAELFGLGLDGAHAAYVDTRATAALLSGYLQIAFSRNQIVLDDLTPSFVGGFGPVELAHTASGRASAVNRDGVDALLVDDYPGAPAPDRLAVYQPPPGSPDRATEWLDKLERYRRTVSCPQCGALVRTQVRKRDGKPFRSCSAWRDTGCDFTQELATDAAA